MKVKIFHLQRPYFSTSATFAERSERAINGWLADHPQVNIVHVHQSASGGSLEPSSVTVSIWYEEAR